MPSPEPLTPKRFVATHLPWLIGLGALVLYWLTLNHAVSQLNIIYVARLSGWLWAPQLYNPLTFLAFSPLRLLPGDWVLIALNLLSALLAAGALALLARSVALLPQDRSPEQRLRLGGGNTFLLVRESWLPPVLSVLVCGLQMTFWEHATNGTGEMLNLFLFSFVVWSLLEYRNDQKDWRLLVAGFVYGAEMSNDWLAVGLLPVFIVSVIWMRGFGFTFRHFVRFFTRANLHFFLWITLCGLAGLLFYLMLPAFVSLTDPSWGFWASLKEEIVLQKSVLKQIFGQSTLSLCMLAVTSLLPVLLLSVSWNPTAEDNQTASLLAKGMFHLISLIFLGACLWVFCDPPFSPRRLGHDLPMLPLYYLSALSVGYYAGYFLLAFRPPNRVFLRMKSDFRLQKLAAIVGIMVASFLAVAILLLENAQRLVRSNNDTLSVYAGFVESGLPRAGGMLLCNDPVNMILVRAVLARHGREKDFVPVELSALRSPMYLRYLHDKYPLKWPQTVKPFNPKSPDGAVDPQRLIALLVRLAKTNEIYSLQPGFNPYLTPFYLEPHGLVYHLQFLPTNNYVAPVVSQKAIVENEEFWRQVKEEATAPIISEIEAQDPKAEKGLVERLLAKLHVPTDRSRNLKSAGLFYSRGLDFWGVELERAGKLREAGERFELAEKLNPENRVARINAKFNESLLAGKPVVLVPTRYSEDEFGKSRDWSQITTEQGPLDDPNYCLAEATACARRGLVEPALGLMTRIGELATNNAIVRLDLATMYLMARVPDPALALVEELRANPARFGLTSTNDSRLAIIEASAYYVKAKPDRARGILEDEIARHKDNAQLFNTVIGMYENWGMESNALQMVELRLKSEPANPQWLMQQGLLFTKLTNNEAALSSFDAALAVMTNKAGANTNRAIATARYNRALNLYQIDRLDESRAEYLVLAKEYANAIQPMLGLGDIAWQKHETNSAIGYYEAYLKNAPTNSQQYALVRDRLKSLKGSSK